MNHLSLYVFAILLGLASIVKGQSVTAIWDQPQGDTCAIWGDPHIWTWDGQLYETQPTGYYHLVVSPTINIQTNFAVGCGSPDVTCVYGFRVFIVDDDDGRIHSFELKADFLQNDNGPTPYRIPFQNYGFAYMTYIDNADAHMVPSINGGDPALVEAGVNQLVGNSAQVAYFTDNNIYSIKFTFNDVVIQFLPWTITVTPLGEKSNDYLWQQTCGLCGTYTGTTADDYQARDTTVFSLNDNPDDFTFTWDVTAADTALGYFSCKQGPEPTQPPPTNAPTVVAPTPFPTRPNTPAPTTPQTGAPTPAPTTPQTATPTSSPTPAPTVPQTAAPTPRPTNPVTQGPTPTPGSTPTPAPTPMMTTGSVTTGGSTTGGGNGNQTTNITVIVNNYNGTTAYTNANATCCVNAQICPGDPLYTSCMLDVLKTNSTTLAVSATGAIVLAGCAKTNITDSSCTQGSLFACPGACGGAGVCIQGQCHCNNHYKNDPQQGCIAAGLTQAELIAVGVSAGVVAAIVIGGLVFLALAAFGAKKGYDYYHMNDNKMANVNSNPLYNEKKTGGVSPLYADKA